MFENIRITRKLPMLMIAFALLAAVVSGLTVYKVSSDELKRSAEKNLSSLLESRKASLYSYFNTVERDVLYHAQSVLVASAFKEFANVVPSLSESQSRRLQDKYRNRYASAGTRKDGISQRDDISAYEKVHRKYHPIFRDLLGTRDFHDIFLVSPAGDLIYTVAKELDFATNLGTGEWKHTHLSKAFQDINRTPVARVWTYTDFEQYAPSNNDPASFMGAPVFDNDANYLGVFIVQMPIEELNRVMQVTAGMGESGETYLVGEDLLMRSDSRFHRDSILSQKVDTVSVSRALLGVSGVHLTDDYRGVPVYSAYSPFDFGGVRWAILAEIDQEEIMRPVQQMKYFVLSIAGLLLLGIAVFGLALSNNIAKPIIHMTDLMVRLSRNDLTVEINVPERGDEIGDMADAMVLFKRGAIERDVLQKKLSHMAHHDQLTGLPTRKLSMDRLHVAMEEATQQGTLAAVMFADLDNFKAVNDTLGHHVGDDLLKTVAARISSATREGDTVGRVGGDEFIVVLPNLQAVDNAETIARKILTKVTANLNKITGDVNVSLSLGVAIFPSHADNASDLIRHADEAMYDAKQGGKNDFRVAEAA